MVMDDGFWVLVWAMSAGEWFQNEWEAITAGGVSGTLFPMIVNRAWTWVKPRVHGKIGFGKEPATYVKIGNPNGGN